MRIGTGVMIAGLLAGLVLPAQAREKRPADPAAEAYAQVTDAQVRPARPPTRLRVTPQRLPPTAYRRCADWYVTEYRPSGAVVVPKQRCWWVRG